MAEAERPADSVGAGRLGDDSKEPETELTLVFRKADELTAEGREYSLRTDMTGLPDEHGPGVYTVVPITEPDEISRAEPGIVISEYSILHEVRAPGGYAGRD